jgi:hypothetical protein
LITLRARAAIPLVVALAKLAMWAGIVVVSGRRGHFIALARLRFPPLEIFAQRKLQPLLPRALGRPRASPVFPVRFVRHLQTANHMIPATSQHIVGMGGPRNRRDAPGTKAH